MKYLTNCNRRQFLQMLGGASIFASSPVRARSASDQHLTVSVIHTTDLHGNILPTSSYSGRENLGGLARCATQIRLWKQENPHHILIDAGDLYQGTQIALQTRGKIMIQALNHLGYDAWVLGNHEFDWGIRPVQEAVALSEARTLAANASIDGKPAGWQTDRDQPLGRIAPFIVKRVGGFRIAIIGLITPGMPYWFHERLYRGMAFSDPIPAVERSLRVLQDRNIDAVILAGHMGLLRGGDNFANRTRSLLEAFPNVVAFVGGHTHQHEPNLPVNGIPFTQASYFGIHLGRMDITFDRNTRRIISILPSTMFMDERIALDPSILSMAQPEIDRAEVILDTPVGTLIETLGISRSRQQHSQVEDLIGAAMMESLEARGMQPDAVVHGLIFPRGDFEAGPKTVRDMWSIMPYENRIVTAELTREDLFVIFAELRGSRGIMGMHVQFEGLRGPMTILDISDREGRPLQANRRYLVAFNSYDAASGGQNMMQLREILHRRASRMRLQPILTRHALIDYFTSRGEVSAVTRFAPPPALAEQLQNA